MKNVARARVLSNAEKIMNEYAGLKFVLIRRYCLIGIFLRSAI